MSAVLNLGSFLLGLIAWGIPTFTWFRKTKLNLRKRWLRSGISFSSCIAALCLQFYEIKHRVDLQDFVAIMDTIDALAGVAVILAAVTLLLNLLLWRTQPDRERASGMNLWDYWHAVTRQEADKLRSFFHPEALIRWHNTNEQFTVDEFVRANCEYPGVWEGSIERVETTGSTTITAVRVDSPDTSAAHHVVSFIRIENDKIISIDEYWGEDGPAPEWRLAMGLGRMISRL